MEIVDEHYTYKNKISWVTIDNPPEIIPGIDYWFSYKGHILNDGRNPFYISHKLANKICQNRETSIYMFDIKYPSLQNIDLNGTVFNMYFEKNWISTIIEDESEEKPTYTLRGYSSYLTVNLHHFSLSERRIREKNHIKIEVYNKFINELNSII